jgi:hypothetical protein
MLERVQETFRDAEIRCSLLSRLASEATKVLVITEGLLIYLRKKFRLSQKT